MSWKAHHTQKVAHKTQEYFLRYKIHYHLVWIWIVGLGICNPV